MSGEMSLWEVDAIVHGWNIRQPQDGVKPEDGPMPTDEEWEIARADARNIVELAQNKALN